MAKILVIEDEPAITDFVKRGLVHNGFEVQVAHTGEDGLFLAQEESPDLVVLDLMLPDIDGLDLCRQLRRIQGIGILVFTARHLVGDRVRGLEAGADDYLPKPFAIEELAARIRAVLRRRAPAGPASMKVGDLEIDLDRRTVVRSGRRIDLTTREFDLLQLFAQNVDQPLRREFILQRIWGYDFEGETDPVKVYINFLRRKLNAEGDVDPIATLRGYGYVLKGAP